MFSQQKSNEIKIENLKLKGQFDRPDKMRLIKHTLKSAVQGFFVCLVFCFFLFPSY